MSHGGTFILLIHDLWGADGTQGSSAPYPGDNGDWSSWDNYLTRERPSASISSPGLLRFKPFQNASIQDLSQVTNIY